MTASRALFDHFERTRNYGVRHDYFPFFGLPNPFDVARRFASDSMCSLNRSLPCAHPLCEHKIVSDPFFSGYGRAE